MTISTEGQAEFVWNHIPPFSWVVGKWMGGNLCRVSIELVSDQKRILFPGETFRLRQFRLKIANVRLFSGLYECIKVSGKREESLMALVYLIRDIIVSPFDYYIPKPT